MEVKMRTKTKIFLLWAFMLFALTVSSCKDDGNKPNTPPEPIPDCVTVKPVNVDSITAKQLDSIAKIFEFMLNEEYEYVGIYVINSQKKLDSIYEKANSMSYSPIPIYAPKINFEKYTLVGGFFPIGADPFEILLDEFCKNDLLKTYTRKFDVFINQNTIFVITPNPFCELYPKLDANYKTYLDINLDGDIYILEEK